MRTYTADEVDEMIGRALAREREAQLAQQQQQEPVAVYVGETWCGSVVRLYEDLPLETPLYTAPQPAQPSKPLTDEEISRVWMLNGGGLAANRYHDFARAIEAKLKEKNA